MTTQPPVLPAAFVASVMHQMWTPRASTSPQQRQQQEAYGEAFQAFVGSKPGSILAPRGWTVLRVSGYAGGHKRLFLDCTETQCRI